MYRIANDARVQESADRILSGLERCLEAKPLHDVTVSAIAAAAGVSRATFYRLFDTTADVLQYYSDRTIKSACKSFVLSDGQSVKDSVLASFRALMKHPLLLDAIFTTSRLDIIYRSYLDHELALKGRIAQIVPLDRIQMDYLIYMTNALLAAALQVWYRHGKQESCEDIYRLIQTECTLITEIL